MWSHIPCSSYETPIDTWRVKSATLNSTPLRSDGIGFLSCLIITNVYLADYQLNPLEDIHIWTVVLYLLYCHVWHKYLCFMPSWIENMAIEMRKRRYTHLHMGRHALCKQTDRKTDRQTEKDIARHRMFSSATGERDEEMGREKRRGWMAVSRCHTPAKRTERRALSHRIRVSCSHTRPANMHPAAGRGGEERRGEGRRGGKERRGEHHPFLCYSSISISSAVCVIWILSHSSCSLPHMQQSVASCATRLQFGCKAVGGGGVWVKVGRRFRKGERGLEMNCGVGAQPDNKSLLPGVSESECQCVWKREAKDSLLRKKSFAFVFQEMLSIIAL